MRIMHTFRRLLWNIGYDIVRFQPVSHDLARKSRLFSYYNIDTVLDIGANCGQFATQLRCDIGYTRRILSFEPLSMAFELLKVNAKDDPAWDVLKFAIGDTAERRELNIADNVCSSSLLNMLPSHLKASPNSKYIGKEMVDVKTLDSIFVELCRNSSNIYLKMDTQGYESKVLQGAENCLAHIGTVEMEMSLVPLYAGESLFDEMCILMGEKGYTLVAIENGFSDPGSGQLLQVNGIFHRF